MDQLEVQKLYSLGVKPSEVDVLKTKGLNLVSLLKFAKLLLDALQGSDLLKGTSPVPVSTFDRLRVFGLTDADFTEYVAKGIDLNKILALIMGVLKLLSDLGIFNPTTVPAE